MNLLSMAMKGSLSYNLQNFIKIKTCLKAIRLGISEKLQQTASHCKDPMKDQIMLFEMKNYLARQFGDWHCDNKTPLSEEHMIFI